MIVPEWLVWSVGLCLPLLASWHGFVYHKLIRIDVKTEFQSNLYGAMTANNSEEKRELWQRLGEVGRSVEENAREIAAMKARIDSIDGRRNHE